MDNKPKPKLPEVELATKDWVSMEMRDMEGRIEKAFHDQTLYFTQKFDAIHSKMDGVMKWVIGLIFTLVVALVATIIFK